MAAAAALAAAGADRCFPSPFDPAGWLRFLLGLCRPRSPGDQGGGAGRTGVASAAPALAALLLAAISFLGTAGAESLLHPIAVSQHCRPSLMAPPPCLTRASSTW